MNEPTQLHALADGELAPLEAQNLREALKTDPRGAAEVDAVLNLKEFLAKNSPRHADEEVWRACVRRLDAIDRSRKAEGFVSRYAWALCGIMFVLIVTGRFATRTGHGDSARSADLARFLGAPAPVTERNRMDSRLYEAILGQVGHNLDPNEIEVGMPVRRVVDGMLIQRVPMRDRSGDLILTRVNRLLELQDTEPLPNSADVAFGLMDGANGLVWHHAGETWVLSGDRSVDSLDEVASRLGAH